jgi:outer membrane lipoprotein-sorting protein
MKNSILLTLICVFGLSTTFAQSAETTPKDPKAKAILDKLSEKTKAYTSMQADFDYHMENQKSGIDETQIGWVKIKGNKYKISIAGQEITSDGKTMWTFLKEDKELQINNVPAEGEAEDEIFTSPSKLFTLYEKGFKYVYDGEEKIDGIVVDVIKLYPLNPKEKNYHTVKLYIDKTKIEMKRVTVMAKDGNKYTYTLKNLKTNAMLADNVFTVDPKIAKEVIDLR